MPNRRCFINYLIYKDKISLREIERIRSMACKTKNWSFSLKVAYGGI